MKKLLLVAAALQISMLMANEVYIKGLNKAALVQALYENKSWGEWKPVSKEQAQLASKEYIECLNEHLMQMDVSGNWFDTCLYNSCGKWGKLRTAEEVVQELRQAH